jgi:hypothetical protein
MTLGAVRELCVAGFPLSETREAVMAGLETLIGRLRQLKVPGEAWLGGDFLTKRMDPPLVDGIVLVDAVVRECSPPEQQQILDWIENVDLVPSLKCHVYLHVVWPEGHELHRFGRISLDAFEKAISTNKSGERRGIAMVPLEAEP